MVTNLRELYRYRALLSSLIGRELKIRYRGSVLGFLWTFLNPVLQMVIYSVVFSVYLRNDLPNYSYFLFVGLLPWNAVTTSLVIGTSSISNRRDLITKVKFPPQILPVTIIGAAYANYLLAFPMMVGFGVISHIDYQVSVVAFPLILFTQVLLTTGIVYFVASLNVTFRDLQHIVGNVVMFAFFLTPILYAADQIPARYRTVALLANPFAPVITSYQRIFYYGVWPDFISLGRTALIGFVLFAAGSWFMESRRESFAEFA